MENEKIDFVLSLYGFQYTEETISTIKNNPVLYDNCIKIFEIVNETQVQKRELPKKVIFLLKLYYKLNLEWAYSFIRKFRKYLARKDKSASEWPYNKNFSNYFFKIQKDIEKHFETMNVIPVKLKRWPENYNSCAIISHDIDRKLGDEINWIIDIEKEYNVISLWNFIANSRYYALDRQIINRLIENSFSIGCHGYNHDRILAHISPEKREKRIVDSIKIFRSYNIDVKIFRAPILSRSDDLIQILERNDFLIDSSYPDIDNLTMNRYGMGVRINYPFFPYNENEKQKSRILEVPVSVPQDIEIIDRKLEKEDSIKLYHDKINYVKNNEGLINFIFHPHLLRDEKNRKIFSEVLRKLCQDSSIWKPSIGKLYEWCRVKKSLKISTKEKSIVLQSEEELENIKIMVKNSSEYKEFQIKKIQKGENKIDISSLFDTNNT